MAPREPHRQYSFDLRRDALMRTVSPWSRCWRCGKTLAEHEPHRNGRKPWWEAGHVVDGDPRSPLALEASTCNRKYGGKAGAKRGGRRFGQDREPRSPNA